MGQQVGPAMSQSVHHHIIRRMLIIFNRITIHNASWDYEGSQPRHGTRVTALAEAPYFQQDAPSRREALGLASEE